MAKAILRTEKIKSHANVSSSIQHALRERETKNADQEKTIDNEVIVPFDEEKFIQDVEANRTTKFLDGRNANVICLELLLTASPEHWEGKSKEDIDKWSKENMKWVEEKFGKENIVSAVLHVDEVSPHLSVHIIPIVRDKEKQGLGCKKWTGTPALMREMQDGYAEQMKQFGLERGERGSIADHKTVQEFYAELEKIKAETLKQNPDVKVGVTPDQLRDPSLGDRANIKDYKAEVIKDTVAVMQKQVDKLTDQNKKLTAKLLTAENKIEQQGKELSKHRANVKVTTDELHEYREIKDVVKKPEVAKAIHLAKNPHIGLCRKYREEGKDDKTIAYDMLKNDKLPKAKVFEAMSYDGGFGYTINKTVEEASVKVDKDLATEKVEREQAKIQAEQAKAQAEIAQREHVRITKRREHIQKNPHVKEYLALASRGMSDEGIANRMLHKGFEKKDVVMAIATESPKAPDRSDQATVYARGIVNPIDKAMKTPSKGKGGGMAGVGGRGGGGRSVERDIEPSRPLGGGMTVGHELSDDERIQQLMDKGMSEEMAIQIVSQPDD